MSFKVIFKIILDIFGNDSFLFNFVCILKGYIMKRLLITIAAIIISNITTYSKEQFIYTSISKNEGLASTVNCIYKEKDGEIWIGSPKGLYTFNGYDLKRHNDTLFLNRSIYKMEEDIKGGTWVLTDNWVMYKRKGEERFTHMKAESPYKEPPFYSICQDEEGIWFGSQGLIYRYTYKDERLYLFSELQGRKDFFCSYLNKVNDNMLLCCSNYGSLLIDTATGKITENDFGPNNEVCGTMTDSRGRLWISFYNNGIKVFEKDGTLIRTYTTKNSQLSNDLVICFTEKDSKIWAGTDGGGVNIIDPENDSIMVLSHVSGDPSSFPAYSIKTIYTDNYGNIWAGSTRNGLIKISQSGMKTYTDSHIGLSSGLSNPCALCLFQEKDEDVIWIGTDGGGLNRFDPESNRFTHFPNTLKTKVVSIATYSDTELALSVYADKIWLFNKKNGSISPMPLNDEKVSYFMKYTGRSLILANGSDGSLFLLTNQVRQYDKKTGTCHIIPPEAGEKSFGNIFAIGTSDKALYLHDINSIYRLDEGTSELKKIGTFEEGTIMSGSLGKDGDIWIGTDKGLRMFNEHTRKISTFSTNLFKSVSAVVWDGKSRVWIGADSNLYAYLTDQDSFAMFGKSDGASPNEYLAKPRLLAHNGDVLIGGVQGLLSIDSGYEIDTSEEPLVKLYSIRVDKERVYPDKKGFYEIPRDGNILNISVSTQETDIFRQKMYRFSFSGGGNEYELLSPTLEIQDLPDPGRYELMVSCTKRNGEWSEPVHVLSLKVPQPWYKTWWFIGSTFLLILLTTLTWLSASQKKKESKLLIALKEKDEAVNQEKIRLLINMSHELRTPLTLIMGPLKRLLKGMGPDQEHYEALGRIYRQSRRMTGLLNMVLDLRKMETGNDKLNIERQEFNRWILETAEDIVNEEMAEDISIGFDLSPDITEVDFDKKKCDTVLINILMNAIKHSKGGDRISVRTELREGNMVRVSISDEGPGIIGVDLDRLFTPFYQSDKEKYGSGIGLSYSKILVELHGGRIGAENNFDKGATFWWEIPVRCEGSISMEVPARSYLNELMGYDTDKEEEAPESENFNTGNMTLMLVDDNKDLLEFLREALSSDFGNIILAQSGNQAMTLLTSGKLPDIIVSDVNMPDGNGYRLCKDVKSDTRYSHIPVILLASRGEEQSQSNSYRMGADAFLAKPFETETLTEAIRGLLRKRAEIRRKYLDSKGTDVSEYGSNEESFIMKLNAIIGKHIDNPDLDQQLLCRELGISRALLYNKMKAIVGTGTKEYVTKIRLEKAKHLIETTKLPVAEIAEKTGFTSQGYFSTAFKSYTGMTPSQYRQNIGKQS